MNAEEFELLERGVRALAQIAEALDKLAGAVSQPREGFPAVRVYEYGKERRG